MQHIHERLRAGEPVNANIVGRELETSARTIQRDLDFMRDALGLPIVYEPERRTFVYTWPVDPAIFGKQAPAARTVIPFSSAETGSLLDQEAASHLDVICVRHGLHAKDVLRAVIGSTLADAVCDSLVMAAMVRTARSLAAFGDRDEQREAA